MRRLFAALFLVTLSGVVAAAPVVAGKPLPVPTFSTAPLIISDGRSAEPSVAVGKDGTTYVVAPGRGAGVVRGAMVWKGPFGSPPAFQGAIDTDLGEDVLGGGDADVDISSTGTVQFATLLRIFNTQLSQFQRGVSSIRCPGGDLSNSFANCQKRIIDQTQSDRQWISTDGPRAYISYHDSGNSAQIKEQVSIDDGVSWKRTANIDTGSGNITADSTFNNFLGPIVADPITHGVYQIWVAGEPQTKCCTTLWNKVYVARSNDGGKSWTSTLVYRVSQPQSFDSSFPVLAVDPVTGGLYASFADTKSIYLSTSLDHGVTWSAPAVVSKPTLTTLFPWVAARNNVVDVVYYGTSSASKDDPAAVWNTYMAKSTDGGRTFSTATVSPRPNHVGPICTEGTICPAGTRNLLDFFEVAINPLNGKAAVVYADDTLVTDPATGAKLAQTVIAFEK